MTTIHQISTCPGCGSGEAAPISLGSTPLRRCRSCAVVYATSFVDPDEVYVEGYQTGGSEFGIDLSNPIWAAVAAFSAGRRFDVLRPRLPGAVTLLDVGCGAGDSVAAANARGFRATGIDLVAAFVERGRAQGLDLRVGRLDESDLPEASFDVVSAFHVVEHMVDAPAFLRMLGRWARPGGHVALEVPNWASVDRRRTQGDWPHLRTGEHVAHYSPASLRATLRRSGFEDVWVSSISYVWPRLGRRTQVQSLVGSGSGLALDPRPDPAPRPWQRRAIRGVERALDAGRVGHMVLATARVPGPR